ncbi:NAD(P)-dependent dehydrogenase (short-subunit alcohol dehydrogenase family) [Promicromonospora sp. AC04]|uniref:SDR family NAD(P)-dependent oxidoreductase n=1 Tax=Promicromonospora sp. AC04 TaxID=2135723 RepID=UPI000D365EFD|nr:SDR family NAD(P)-dependent oxidoreductase [Promicromonospora sp. AC04]PUB29802.1 NAD(P)-dependent dehydrogenase (short-subunit alcohol dehydrogenase family) [Promicromonospora sp. AC04]
MTTTLITGANKSLGYETARRLVEAGHTVYVAARDLERGKAAAAKLGARFVQLDVTDDDSVRAAADAVRVEAGHLDVLVNNAGILGASKTPGDVTGADMQTVYDTNVFGPVRVTRAFLPLLQDSDNPVVVNVSSGLGSLAAVSDPSRVEYQVKLLDYNSSKAALVMVNAMYAKEFPGIRFNAVDPGYTATDFNDHSGYKTVEQGAEILVQMALIGPDGPTGGFYDEEGPVIW